MKNFIKKHISIILSLALVIGTIVPVISGNFANAETGTEQQDIAALKTAWEKIRTTDATVYSPVAYRAADKDHQVSTLTSLTGNDSSFLGSFQATYDVLDGKNLTIPNTGNSYTLFLSPSPDKLGGDYKCTDETDLSVYFKANTVIADGRLGFKIISDGSTFVSNITMAVNSDSVGKWQKVSLSEIYADGSWANLSADFDSDLELSFIEFFKKHKFSRMEVCPITNLSANITVGSVMTVSGYKLPADSNSWDIGEWITNAMNFDTSKSTNSAEFTTLVNQLKKKYEKEVAVSSLKLAWASMSTPKDILYPSSAKVNNASRAVLPTADRKVTEDGNLPYSANASMLGGYYSYYHESYDNNYSYAKADKNSSERILLYGSPDGFTHGTADLTEISGFYFNIYIEDVKHDGSITSAFINKNNATLQGKTIAIDSSMKGKWITLKDTDLFDGGVAAIAQDERFTTQPQLASIMLSLGEGLILKACIGSVITFANCELPSGSETWSAVGWALESKHFDSTGYHNREEFLKASELLMNACGNDTIIAELKYAWSQMYSEKTLLFPSLQKANNVTSVLAPELIKNTAAGNLPYGANADLLGTKYAYHSASYDGNYCYASGGVNSTERVLYYASTTAATFGTAKCSDITAFSLSFYVEDVKHSGVIATSIVNNKFSQITGKAIAIDESMEGKWITLKDTDFIDGGVKTIDEKFSEKNQPSVIGFLNFCFSQGLIMKGYFGSFVASNPVVLPTNTTNWTLSDWVYAASKVNPDDYKNSAPFVEALARVTEARDQGNIERGAIITSYANAGDIDTTSFGNNILLGITPTVEYFDGTETSNIATKNEGILTDGSFTNDFVINGLPYSNSSSFTEIIYKFNGEATVNKALISNAVNSALRNMRYSIYMSSTETELFDADSLLSTYKNESVDQAQVFDYGDASNVSGTYFGIIIYGPASDMQFYDGSVRFTEIGLYGVVQTFNVTTGDFNDQDIASIGTNLLSRKDIVPKVKDVSGARVSWASAKIKYLNTNLSDGKISTVIGYREGISITSADDEISAGFFFDLKSTYSIKKFLWNNFYKDYLQTGKYEIYASLDANSLFLEKNKVVSYNNMEAGPNGTSISQLFDMLGNGVVARYVAFIVKFPCSNYEQACTRYGEVNANFIRLSELGVYGTPYVKPYKLVNLLGHVPTTVYRTDSVGTHTAVPESEYNGTQHKMTFDGNPDEAVTINRKGKALDFVYNLGADMKLNVIDLQTLTNNLKNVKIYASSIEDLIWSSESLVYTYDGTETGNVRKEFPDNALLKARYLRISICDTVNDTVDITEIEAMGGNDQEFYYMNFMQENSGSTGIYLENRANDYNLSVTNALANRFPVNDYGYKQAFDDDFATVANIYGGDNDSTSINILADLKSIKSIDDITLCSASTEDYWPEDIRFYIGKTDTELFGKNATPIKAFSSKQENGSYKYEFLPKATQYVRIEIRKAKHKYYDNKILAVISEIQISGLEIVGRTGADGVVKSLTDPETGIRLDIMGLSENDSYDGVQSIKVVARDPSDDDKDNVKGSGVRFLSPVYDIYMFDINDNLVEDLGGRTLRVCIPQSLVSKTDDVYVLAGDFGSFNLIETETVDGYYVFNAKDPSNLSYALGEFYDYPIDETTDDNDDDYYDELSDDYSFDDFDDTDDTLIDDDVNSARRVKKMMVKKNNGTDDYLTWILIIAGSVILVAAAGFCFYFFVFKKKKKEEEEPDTAQ